jgi:hypothetical protein
MSGDFNGSGTDCSIASIDRYWAIDGAVDGERPA